MFKFFTELLLVGIATIGLAALCTAQNTPPADLEADGVSPEQIERFIDRGDYVEDTTTGLLWQKDGDESGKMNYIKAAEYAEGQELGGRKGWRVPTRKELAEIFPATNSPFQDTQYTKPRCCQGPYAWHSYWTSDLDTRRPHYAYVYHWYADGGANNCGTGNLCFVRCVHDPIDASEDPMIVSEEPIVLSEEPTKPSESGVDTAPFAKESGTTTGQVVLIALGTLVIFTTVAVIYFWLR